LSSSDKQLLTAIERGGGSGAIYGAADRVRSQRGVRERFKRGLEISGRYDAHFREIMRAKGVPEDLAYLPHVESSFQTHARSSVGAAGVWQFMPATGRDYGMRVDRTIDERLDPIICADGAARYLSAAHRKLGSWPLAITSYNHGKGGMANARAQHGNDIGRIVRDYKGRAFGFASRNFYASFVAAREVARHPERYFPEGVRYEAPWAHERLVLRSQMPADHVARHYGVSTTSLAGVNMHWRERAADGSSLLPAGSTVWLPPGSMRRVASHPPAYQKPVAAPSSATLVAGNQTAPKSKPAGKAPVTASATLASSSKPAKAKTATATTAKAKSSPKYHIVKPDETLYRVALNNGISVEQLRRLNRLGPNDNTIRTGQRLKVGI
jgi:membrane-bound lytic murein transglycosylase D